MTLFFNFFSSKYKTMQIILWIKDYLCNPKKKNCQKLKENTFFLASWERITQIKPNIRPHALQPYVLTSNMYLRSQ